MPLMRSPPKYIVEEYMRLQLISELQHGRQPYVNGEFLDPDDFYRLPGAVPFIYNDDGTLLTGDYNNTHLDIICQNLTYYRLADYNFKDFSELQQLHINSMLPGRDNLRKEFSKVYVNAVNLRSAMSEQRFDDSLDQPMALEKGATRFDDDEIIVRPVLVGRVSPNKQYVAFWKYNDLMAPCLKALFHEGFITLDTIFANGRQHMPVRTFLRGGRFAPSPEDDERREMMQQLHLMGPQQKKAAMKKLNLIGGGHKQPWQKAAEQNKVVSPGQKWWATTSESSE